ncbi:hypothetical protein Trisim1_000940 [Trichoderma cf. simile WF8]
MTEGQNIQEKNGSLNASGRAKKRTRPGGYFERLITSDWSRNTGLDWTLSPVNRERGEREEKVEVSSQGHKQGKALAGWMDSVRALWSRYRRRIIIRPAGSAQDSEEIEEAEV